MKHSLPEASPILHTEGEPRAALTRWRLQQTAPEALLLVDFELPQYWLQQAPPVPLTAIYCLVGEQLQAAVTDRPLVADGASPLSQYKRWVTRHGLVNWRSGLPLELAPHSVAKPWGREIWYSGVERRGVCHFILGAARTPIPWLQAVVPEGEAGPAGEPLLLLKILDPLPQPVLGDLYFEMHEEKREVYVVTHVDRRAWPDGTGYIRMGFDPQRVAECGGEAAFRRNYLEAVQAYERVRRELDRPDHRERVPDAGLLAREETLRQVMNGFTRLAPLRVGDVVPIPLRVPHSLQHGVRTVEFQTPVYERKILSFAQRVLTQDHWDTAGAVRAMELQAPPPPAFQVLRQGDGLRVERVVDFADFEVIRVRVSGGARWPVGALQDYALLMVVEGVVDVDGASYGPEQALLLPLAWEGELAAAEAAQSLVLLWATPRG